ncbi:hypothetical protein T439DRAFT_93584 [Meredithblackwellia eburnea MCA 4105]
MACTGNARQGQIEEYLASGFDDAAIKPYNFKILLQQARKLAATKPPTRIVGVDEVASGLVGIGVSSPV